MVFISLVDGMCSAIVIGSFFMHITTPEYQCGQKFGQVWQTLKLNKFL